MPRLNHGSSEEEEEGSRHAEEDEGKEGTSSLPPAGGYDEIEQNTVVTNRDGRTIGTMRSLYEGAHAVDVDKLLNDVLGYGDGPGDGGGADDESTALSSLALPLSTPLAKRTAGPPQAGTKPQLHSLVPSSMANKDGRPGNGGGAVPSTQRVQRGRSGDDKGGPHDVDADLDDLLGDIDVGGGNDNGGGGNDCDEGDASTLATEKPREIFVPGRGAGADGGSSVAVSVLTGPMVATATHHRHHHSDSNYYSYRGAQVASRRRGRTTVGGRHGGSIDGERSAAGKSAGGDTAYTNGVSSILESMGIGPGATKGGGFDYAGVSKYGRSKKDAAASTTTADDRFSEARARRRNRMMHLRAAVLLLSLVGCMFAIVQLTAMMKHDQSSMRTLRDLQTYHGGGRRSGNAAARGVGGIDRGGTAGVSDRLDQFRGGEGRGVRGQYGDGDGRKPGGVYRGVKRTYDDGDGEGSSGLGGGGDDNVANLGFQGDGGEGSAADVDPLDVLPMDDDGKAAALQEPLAAGAEARAGANGPVDALPPVPVAPKKAVSAVASTEDLAALVEATLPESFHYLSDVLVPDPDHKDTPLFWQIPRSGSGMIKNVLTECLGAVLACEVGEQAGHEGDEELKVVSINQFKYVNVDVSTLAGIERAKSMALGSSGLADIIVTPHIQVAPSLFDADHHGRAFALVRHPVVRAVSMYYFLKESGHEAVSKLTIEEYAKSPHAENNWMTRFLSGTLSGAVTTEHLAVAKEVLRAKFVVGMLENKLGSMRRFEEFFGWSYTTNPKQQYECRKRILDGNTDTNEMAKKRVKEDSQAWSLLLWQNQYDMKLYEYSRHLFAMQGKELFPNLEVKIA